MPQTVNEAQYLECLGEVGLPRDDSVTRDAAKAFGKRLDAAIKRAGLNPNRVAKALKTSASRVSAWVEGESMPGGEHMVRLPILLGVDGHWLLTGEGEPEPIPVSQAERALSVVRSVLDSLETDPDRFDRLASWWEALGGDDAPEMDDSVSRQDGDSGYR